MEQSKPSALPSSGNTVAKTKVDIAASTRASNKQTVWVLVIVGLVFAFLFCLVAVGGWIFIQQRSARLAVLRSTQTVIAQVRTATAQVVATRSTIATKAAEPTMFAQATQAQATAAVIATQDAETSADLLARTELWKTVFTDTFDTDPGTWYTGADEDELVKGTWSIKDGQYVVDLEAKDNFSQWMWPDPGPQVGDFTYSARLAFAKGPDEMDGGLIFRLQEDGQFYLFDLTAGGNYAIYRHAAGDWVTIIDKKIADPFTVGGTNLLEVIAEGNKFTLLINGVKVDSFRDSNLNSGGIGVLLGLPAAGDQGAWTFDDIVVRTP